jgi:TPR repeat protein
MRCARTSGGLLSVLALCALAAPAQAEIGQMKNGLWQMTLTNPDSATSGGITRQICITDASRAVFQAEQDRLKAKAKTQADCTVTEHGTSDSPADDMVCKDGSGSVSFTRTDPDHFSTSFSYRVNRSIGGVKMDPIALKNSYDWIKSDCGTVAEFRGVPMALVADNISPGAVAEFRTGYMYERGTGVTQDYAAAMQHYLTAAAEGNAVAEFRIGYLYEHGWGVPVDFAQASAWYAKAAAHGNPQAATRGQNLKAKDGAQ